MKFSRVNKNQKCPVCHQPDWCGISTDGNVVACMRVESPKQARNGAWLHFLNDGDARKPAVKVSLRPDFIAPFVERTPEDISEIYSAFLAHLVLAKNHEIDLRNRGLDFWAIELHGYKSMPTPIYAANICASLAKDFDLRGVPGFYRRAGLWRFIDYRFATGYLIPIRNRRHQIVALQLRRDDDRKPKYLMMSSGWQADGANSGTPAHFSTLGKIYLRENIKSLIVTEGALKANVASGFTDLLIVGLVSVTTFNEAFPVQLKEAFPNLEKAQIAFDMDAAANEAVWHQRNRLCRILREADIATTILTWKREFKGLDDYLLSRHKNQKIAA